MTIISFPTKEVSDWVSFERDFVPILRKAGLSPDAEAELLRQMKPFIELLQLKFTLELPPDCPDKINEQIDQFILALNDLTIRLINERIGRETAFLKVMGLW